MADYEVVRTVTIKADASTIHPLINDFHEWKPWSPWEDIDPSMQRTYSGPHSGVGARYTWSGNRKAGSGSMEITGVEPRQIDVTLAFLKPFKATNRVSFELNEGVDGTEVSWRMRGTQTGLMAIFGKFISMDKLVGKDFEKGLGRLKALVESGS